MKSEIHLQPQGDSDRVEPELNAELERARAALMEAEAELAHEQAAVNSFRMHSRLRLDFLVDSLFELRSERESLFIRLVLLRQGIDPELLLEEDDPLQAAEWEDRAAPVEVLLPTPTENDKAAEKRLYRELARRFHPDLAASAFERAYRTTMMSAVNSAYHSGDTAALYDLAGELAPQQAESLTHISNKRNREIQRTITIVRALHNRAVRQLQALREENTARLWRRAALLEDTDEDGWSAIRRELQEAIDRRRLELKNLHHRIDELEEAGAGASAQ